MSLSRPSRGTLLLLALALAGCEGSERTILEPTTEPWTVQFDFGSTSINAANVQTTRTSESPDRLTDAVATGAIPDGELEFFVTHVYIPTDQALHTRVDSVSFVATRADGSATPNFVQGVFYLGRVQLEGQLFDLYRLQGLHLELPVLTAATLARLEIGFTVSHTRPDEGSLNSSRKTVVLEKQ